VNFGDFRDILETCRAGAANTEPDTDHMFLLGGNVAPTTLFPSGDPPQIPFQAPVVNSHRGEQP
jgi:hypothetical protein